MSRQQQYILGFEHSPLDARFVAWFGWAATIVFGAAS